MPNVPIYNKDGSKTGNIDLSEAVFGIEINQNAMHDAVLTQLANKRQGTQSCLTRSEVRGGGIKPFRQKGTGRARQGTIRAPQMEGGGVVFAPKPRDYSQKINKKAKTLAVKSALSQKAADEQICVIDEIKLDAPKTKAIKALISALKAENPLIVLAENDQNVIKSARNIPGVQTIQAALLNTYDILDHDTLFIAKDALSTIEEVFA